VESRILNELSSDMGLDEYLDEEYDDEVCTRCLAKLEVRSKYFHCERCVEIMCHTNK